MRIIYCFRVYFFAASLIAFFGDTSSWAVKGTPQSRKGSLKGQLKDLKNQRDSHLRHAVALDAQGEKAVEGLYLHRMSSPVHTHYFGEDGKEKAEAYADKAAQSFRGSEEHIFLALERQKAIVDIQKELLSTSTMASKPILNFKLYFETKKFEEIENERVKVEKKARHFSGILNDIQGNPVSLGKSRRANEASLSGASQSSGTSGTTDTTTGSSPDQDLVIDPDHQAPKSP